MTDPTTTTDTTPTAATTTAATTTNRRSRPSKGLAALEAAARESAQRGERVRVSASRVYGVWPGGRAGARALARLAETVCLVEGYEDSAQWAPGDAHDAWGAAEDGEWRLTIDW